MDNKTKVEKEQITSEGCKGKMVEVNNKEKKLYPQSSNS